MTPDSFSRHLGDQRGRGPQPVPDLAIELFCVPEDHYFVHLMRREKALYINLAALGLRPEDTGEARAQKLITDVGAYVLFQVQEDPEIGEDELDGHARYAFELFSEASVAEREARGGV